MVSKTGTLILIIHVASSLALSLFIQAFEHAQPVSPSWVECFPLYATLHSEITLATFVFTSLLKYLSPKNRRISIKRHVFTAIFLAPLLAQLLGRWKGWLVDGNEDPVVWTSACYEQLDARDPTVILKSAFCEFKYGISRSQVERSIGRRRERYQYETKMTSICQEYLRDMGHGNGWDGVCWMGKDDGDEWGERWGSQREWFRRGFEECHQRFGIDARLEWRGERPFIKYRMPVIKGTQFDGGYMEMPLDPSEMRI